MEYKKGMMKIYLAENLRSLMLSAPFEKITIKQICDKTGVIRATFYNYYEDKYDCLNSVLHHDLVTLTLPLLGKNDIEALVRQLFVIVEEQQSFYQLGFRIQGQNSFSEMMRKNLTEVFENFFKRYRKPEDATFIPNHHLAIYYAESLSFALQNWVSPIAGYTINKENRDQYIHLLLSRSMKDFLQ